MKVKTIKVKNPKNVLVQIPGFVAKNWDLEEGDSVEVFVDDSDKSIKLVPRKGHILVRPKEV